MTELSITRTKVLPPQRRADLLSRQRLLDMLLDLLDLKLVLILAPAGYGKTSLLVDMVEQLEMPISWYSLDPLDADLHRFIRYFCAALEEQFPQVGGRVRGVLDASTGQLDIDQVVSTLVNALLDHVTGHFIIVLDDYHLVADLAEINQFISRLVQQSGNGFHLVLASRRLPPLPDLTLMAARRQVGGFSFEELAFRPEEVQALLLQVYRQPISPALAKELVEATEGWITGLMLSTRSIGQSHASPLPVISGSGVDLYEYLAQQVLEQQEATVRDFLLRSSVMEEFDAELCDAVLGEALNGRSWSELMAYILRSNLFVTSVGEGGAWIRYHHLFRDFLQARLTREQPGEANRLRSLLAGWYARRQDWEKAHSLYQQSGAVDADAELIAHAGSSFIKRGRAQTLAAWIDSLPVTLRNARPALLSLRASTFLMMGQVPQSIFLYDQAIRGCQNGQDRPLLARTLVRRAVAHRRAGQYDATLADAEEALAIAETEGLQDVHAEALRMKGTSLYRLGRTQEAIRWYTHSLTIYELLGEPQNVATVQVELGIAETHMGRYARALDHAHRALAYWETSNKSAPPANILNNIGVLHHLRGEYEAAIIALERAFTQAEQHGDTRMVAYILCSIGDLYVELDALAPAQAAYRQSREQAQLSDDRYLLFYLSLAEASLMHLGGQLDQARYIIEAARSQVEQSGSDLERALWSLARGRLLLREGTPAVACLQEAVEHLAHVDQRPEEARAHLYLAVALKQAGAGDASHLHVERAFRLAAQLESNHTLLMAGRELAPYLHDFQSLSLTRLLAQVDEFNAALPTLRRGLRKHIRLVALEQPALLLRALGDASAVVESKAIEWEWAKVRDLLFCLLLHPQGLTKEEVGERLWPDISPARLKARFKEAIQGLRRAIGGESVRFDGLRYSFNRAVDYEYDVELFLTDLQHAARLTAPTEQIHVYQRALQHYRGTLLPLVEDEWVQVERARLHSLYLDGILHLASLHLALDELQATLDTCEALLRVEPSVEEGYRLAMRVHARRGNRAEVVRQFERCQEAMEREVGVPPSEQTIALYQRLLE